MDGPGTGTQLDCLRGSQSRMNCLCTVFFPSSASHLPGLSAIVEAQENGSAARNIMGDDAQDINDTSSSTTSRSNSSWSLSRLTSAKGRYALINVVDDHKQWLVGINTAEQRWSWAGVHPGWKCLNESGVIICRDYFDGSLNLSSNDLEQFLSIFLGKISTAGREGRNETKDDGFAGRWQQVEITMKVKEITLLVEDQLLA